MRMPPPHLKIYQTLFSGEWKADLADSHGHKSHRLRWSGSDSSGRTVFYFPSRGGFDSSSAHENPSRSRSTRRLGEHRRHTQRYRLAELIS